MPSPFPVGNEKCTGPRCIFPPAGAGVELWWAHLDLNQGPAGYEPAALTS